MIYVYLALGCVFGACVTALWCQRARIIDDDLSFTMAISTSVPAVLMTIGPLTYPLSIAGAEAIQRALTLAIDIQRTKFQIKEDDDNA
jgi:hypothetical protein